jgi:hypothetical protein
MPTVLTSDALGFISNADMSQAQGELIALSERESLVTTDSQRQPLNSPIRNFA